MCLGRLPWLQRGGRAGCRAEVRVWKPPQGSGQERMRCGFYVVKTVLVAGWSLGARLEAEGAAERLLPSPEQPGEWRGGPKVRRYPTDRGNGTCWWSDFGAEGR